MKEQSIKIKVETYLSLKLKSAVILLRTWELRLSIWRVSKKLQRARLKRWKKQQ